MRFLDPRWFVVVLLLVAVPDPTPARAGFPWFWRKPKRLTPEWWEHKATVPTGARQVHVGGKQWPPYPRPVGDPQPFLHRYHTTLYWPYPYDCQDRWFVRTLTQRQVDNGWIDGTTLYDYHFDPKTHELNSAGRLHLQWILRHAPARHRLAYVQQGAAPEISEARLANVRAVAQSLVGEGALPPVVLRTTTATGRLAEEVDIIRRQELETIPEPRVPVEHSTTQSNGSSGSSSSSGSSN